jgi:hypothetical protein
VRIWAWSILPLPVQRLGAHRGGSAENASALTMQQAMPPGNERFQVHSDNTLVICHIASSSLAGR